MRHLIFFSSATIVLGACLPANAHSIGYSTNQIPPPLKVEMQEADRLAKDLANDSPIPRGMINSLKLWPFGRQLSACFFDGDSQLRSFFVEVSKVWTTGTSMVIDFASGPTFSSCNNTKPSDIRISFARSGSWSYVGTDSRRYDLDGPSLNVDYSQGRTWETMDKKEFAHLILHELGHALALEHEHQSPEAACDAEFDWSKVYAQMKRDAGWSTKEVDFNMRALASSPRLRTTEYDKKSIMHYYFAPWMFIKGKDSKCYVSDNSEPSSMDLKLMRESYPLQVALQDSQLQARADASSAQLANLKLTSSQLSKVGLELTSVLARFERPLSLEFNFAGEEQTRGPDQQILKDCAASPTQANQTASCQVSRNATQLVIRVQPN